MSVHLRPRGLRVKFRAAGRRSTYRQGRCACPRSTGRESGYEMGSTRGRPSLARVEHVRAHLARRRCGCGQRCWSSPACRLRARASPADAGGDGPDAVHPARRWSCSASCARSWRPRPTSPTAYRCPGRSCSRSLYLLGLVPAVLLQALAVVLGQLLLRRSAVADRLQHRPVRALAARRLGRVLVVAGVRTNMSAGRDIASPQRPGWIVLSWVAFHLVNLALVAAPPATDGQTWWEAFTEDFWYYTFSMFAVLAVAPFVVVMAAVSVAVRPAAAAAAVRRLQDRVAGARSRSGRRCTTR